MHPSSESPRRVRAFVLVSLLALLTWGVQGLALALQGGGIAVNGGFEDGDEGWTLGAGARIALAGEGAAEGAFVLELDMPSEDGAGLARQYLSLVPGREYELSYRYQRSFAEKKLRLPVTLHEHTPYHAVTRSHFSSTVPDTPVPLSDGWETQTARFFATHDVSPIQFGPITFPDGPLDGGHVWIDDIVITELGSAREVGVDHDYLITVPSEAVVGEPVEVHVACMDVRGKQGGFRVRGMPVPTFASMNVVADHASTVAPAQLEFQGQAWRTFTVTFQEGGIHRLRLSHSNGHARLSNPVLVTPTPVAARSYWGDLHIHTQYNHGGWVAGDGYQNYAYARDIARLDFAALSEHFPQSAALPYIHQMSDATELYYEPGRFATFFGSERGLVEGHHNTYLRSDDRFDMADPREQKFDTLRERLAFYAAEGTPVIDIPHHFALLDPTDWRLQDRRARPLVELYSDHGSSEVAGEWWRHPDHDGNDYSATMGAEGHDYLAALERGHRLGVIAASDDHFARPGIEGLACVRAPALDRSSVWDEMQARHCYATSGARILLNFSVGGVGMGDEWFAGNGQNQVASVRVHGTAPLEAVEIVSDGEVVYSATPNALDFVATDIALGPFNGRTTYYYLRVRQSDEHRAWSSPVWVSPALPDLVVEPGDVTYDHGAQTLAVAAQNYGSQDAPAVVRVFTSERHPSLELNPLLGSEVGVVANVRPFSANQALVEFFLYLPSDYNEVFDFSGEVQLSDAAAYRIAVDPRGMLVDEGDGRVTWDEGPYGYKVAGSASHSGRVTDFALLVDTTEATALSASFAIDGLPIEECWIGKLPSGAPGAVQIDLGLIADETEMAEEELPLVAAGTSGLLTFGGVLPGRSYVIVVDPDDEVLEADEHNNSCVVAVPAVAPSSEKWTDIEQPPLLPQLEVRPRTSGMDLDDVAQLRAIGIYADGAEVDATHVAEWTNDPTFGSLLSVEPGGRVVSKGYEVSARVHADLQLDAQSTRSNDALVWASNRIQPAILSAGFEETYLDEGNPSQALTVTARVAQRDNFTGGTARVAVLNPDGTVWTPYGSPVVLRDDGLGADPVGNDGEFSAIVSPGPQSDASAFSLGDNAKVLSVDYLTGNQTFPAITPWPFHLEGAPGDHTFPTSPGPPQASDAEVFVGPRVVSAGTRGFGGLLPSPGGAAGAPGAKGIPFGQVGDARYLFLEVEVAGPTDPSFAGAETRVVARLPWSTQPVELRPSSESPGVYHLLVRTHPTKLKDGMHRIDVRAETYLRVDDGGSTQEWWPSDWWPRLRLHQFLPDD